MDKLFIRIGHLYINVAHIIDISAGPDIVRITISELTGDSVGLDSWIATNAQLDFPIGSDEAKAVIDWANRQSELLL